MEIWEYKNKIEKVLMPIGVFETNIFYTLLCPLKNFNEKKYSWNFNGFYLNWLFRYKQLRKDTDSRLLKTIADSNLSTSWLISPDLVVIWCYCICWCLGSWYTIAKATGRLSIKVKRSKASFLARLEFLFRLVTAFTHWCYLGCGVLILSIKRFSRIVSALE